MVGLHYTALVLAIIGALNWGLVGLFEFDLVAALFGGNDSIVSRIVYILVGLAGLILLATSMSRNPRIASRDIGGHPAGIR